jgi:cystathionine beta-lyase
MKGAGLTALAGAAGTLAGVSTIASAQSPIRMRSGMYDFDTVYDRIGSNCSRWDSPPKRYDAGKVRYAMGVATMDFEAAPCITEALTERIQHHNWGYLSSTDSLRDAIVQWNGERHNLDLDPDSVVVSDGVYPGVIAALRTFAPKGSKVLMLTPTYDGFPYHCRHTQVEQVQSEMLYKNGTYQVDWADLESKMTPETSAFIVCNPQNPTGNVWSQADLLRIGRMCLENQIVVLSDEIHSDIVRDGHQYVPFASLPDEAVVKNSITFNAISKTFNLAGMKNAYFYTTNPILLGRIKQYHRGDLSTLGVVANEAAYRHGADWFDQVRPYLDNNHTLVEQQVAKMPGVSYTKAQGTYLAWLDFTPIFEKIGAAEMAVAHGKASPEHYFQDWLVENAGVYLNPGANYGAGGAGHMRMNLGSSRFVVQESMEAMAAAFKKA